MKFKIGDKVDFDGFVGIITEIDKYPPYKVCSDIEFVWCRGIDLKLIKKGGMHNEIPNEDLIELLLKSAITIKQQKEVFGHPLYNMVGERNLTSQDILERLIEYNKINEPLKVTIEDINEKFGRNVEIVSKKGE